MRVIAEDIREAFNKENPKREWYYKSDYTVYDENKGDAKATCWHCKKTFLCDPMDACCRLCGAPYDKGRCEEFGFKEKTKGG